MFSTSSDLYAVDPNCFQDLFAHLYFIFDTIAYFLSIFCVCDIVSHILYYINSRESQMWMLANQLHRKDCNDTGKHSSDQYLNSRITIVLCAWYNILSSLHPFLIISIFKTNLPPSHIFLMWQYGYKFIYIKKPLWSTPEIIK